MNQETQNQQIIAYLMSGRTLTPLEALDRFGCLRLGARIWDLKKRGFDIKKETVESNGKHYASYYWQKAGG
jgi:hypothetical protein